MIIEEIVILYRINFDSSENILSNAKYRTELGCFGPKNGLSPVGNCSEFISKLEPVKMYLGWDGKIYPQFVMETKYVR